MTQTHRYAAAGSSRGRTCIQSTYDRDNDLRFAMTTYDAAMSEVRKLLSDHDVRAALKYLNSLTPHRYTGMYIFEDPVLRNRYIVDKLNPDLESAQDVPDTATYCVFTRAKGDLFTVTDALQDERLAGHPKRAEIRSYTGVPLLDNRGDVFGTVCHFDHDVVPISDQTVHLLEAIAPLLKSGQPQLP